MSNHSGGQKLRLVRTQLAAVDLAFDLSQAEAIAHRKSPLIISGGPGTGKTSVLIEAAVARINEGQNPDSILFITYGRERASEIRDAIALRTSNTMHEPLARTFHSLAFSIVKKNYGENYFEPILLSGPEQENLILRLLEGDIEDGYRLWPQELRLSSEKVGEPLLTQGFVRELRDLMMRANERSITPAELAANGEEVDEKYWKAAADFWNRYQEILALGEIGASDAKMRIDPSELLSSAIRLLKSNLTARRYWQNRFTTFLVDEYQESDPAQRELLRLLMGPDLVIAASANSAVGRFRGADPDGLQREIDKFISDGAKLISLTHSYRFAPELFALGKSVAAKLPYLAGNESREVVQTSAAPTALLQPVIVSTLRTQAEQAQYIAYLFKRAHLMQGIDYSQMAVILRSSGLQSSALRRAFAQVGIPVAGDLDALANSAAIAPFLLLARVATGETSLNLDIAQQLLLAEFGGAHSLSLRRIRTSLLRARDEAKDSRSGTQLIIDAIDKGDIPIEDGAELERINQLLTAARVVADRKDARAEDVLWAIWDGARASDGSKLSDSWRAQALRGGLRGASADRDLDAMIQLFDEAARFSERFPYARAGEFLDQIARESIAGDVITARGVRPNLVEILTVHSAKGRQWELVAVTGLQEGSWPNLKVRSSLLGSERLVERARDGDSARAELDARAAAGLATDERRLLHVAITRARRGLVITAISREDDEPSQYFAEINELVNPDSEFLTTEVPRPLTAASLVATLRHELAKEDGQEAASLLKKLSEEGIKVAEPSEWTGSLAISCDEPVVAADAQVPVSPSSGEAFTECGVKWFFEASGGRDGDSTAQILGSAIHEFARIKVQEPEITDAQLIEKLESAWSLIDQSSGWISATALARATKMLRRFALFHAESNREVAAVEAGFEIQVGRALVRGNVDRIEVEQDGSYYVIDFKTGAKTITEKEALTNFQLACYQLGVAMDGFYNKLTGTTTSGAQLVYLASPNKSYATKEQYAIDFDEVKSKIETLAEGVGAATFTATVNSMCKKCVVKSSCPIQNEGRTVIE